jgi:hypothetical protein
VIEATKVEMFGHESISWFGIYNWLVVSNMAFIFHFIYGMSSFPLTNFIIFQDAPPTR